MGAEGSACPRQSVLVLVHPGSACGSADFNLGKFEARAARSGLVLALARWQGGVVVIDGELSDELDAHRDLRDAIDLALTRAADRGDLSSRVMGDDPEQVERIREVVASLGPAAAGMDFEVTGAWLHTDGSGCVGSVIDELRRLGCQAFAHQSAVELCLDVAQGRSHGDDPVVDDGAVSDASMRSRVRC